MARLDDEIAATRKLRALLERVSAAELWEFVIDSTREWQNQRQAGHVERAVMEIDQAPDEMQHQMGGTDGTQP